MKKIVFGLMVSALVLAQSLAYTQSSINEVVISKEGEDKAYSPPDDVIKKQGEVTKEYVLPNNIDISGSENGIIKLPKEVPAIYHKIFDRYTKVNAPNGKPIHILIQSIWTDDQVVQARNVMEYILKDYQESEYGSNKSIVANTMADNHATLILIENEESLMTEEIEKIFINGGLFMQDLRANEIPVIGSDEYMTHTVRDASFEEILHLVHASGIMPGYKSYDDKIQAASDAAEKWGWVGWPDAEPQSHYLEYYAVMLDRHLDLKRIKPTIYEGNGIWQKPAKRLRLTNYPLGGRREEVMRNDPQGYHIIEQFFHPYLTYMPELPASFKGIFSIKYNKDLPYTYKSRYLKDVKLRGENRAILIGNDQANTLIGNAGNNDFIGNEGNDIIDGAEGNDKVFFVQNMFIIPSQKDGNDLIVSDDRGQGDGTDRLSNIEVLQFEDLTYNVGDEIPVAKLDEEPWGNIDPKLAELINQFYHPEGKDKDIYNNSSKADFEAQIKRAKSYLKKLKKINYEKLDLLNQNDYEYFHAQVDNQLQSLSEWKLWEKNPSIYVSFDGYFAASLDKTISEEQRYQNMIDAINTALPSFENGMENLNNPPKVWVEKAIKYANNVKRYMQIRMPKMIENAPTIELQQKMQLVADNYSTNLEAYIDFLKNDLSGRANGITSLGRKEYERALKNYFIDYSVEELIEIGRKAFSENIAQLESTAKEIDPNKTWQKLIDENRLDHVAPWELFDNLRKEAARAKELVYKHLVNVPSDMKEEYHYTKDGHPGTYPIGASGIGPFVFVEDGVYHGYYALPTIEDYDGLQRKNEFMLDWNDSWYVVQQIPHEVYPGHHFQNFMLDKNKRPARILNGALPYTEISATMTEGWSVYNEATMYKLGYYKNNKRLYLSHLQHQLWRIVRTYAEPLYHTGQISFDEVMDMFKEAGTSDGQAWVEATQLTEMPGHDVTYYMGVVIMKNLIQDYKDIVGEENFDLKEFNTRLLECGFMALPLAAKEMLEFAKEKVRN